MTESSAIEVLQQQGAVIKPFWVRSIGFSGLVVRFDEDQRTADGLISAAAVAPLQSLSPMLLELRGVRLAAQDAERILKVSQLAGLDLAGGAGGEPLLARLSALEQLQLADLSLRACQASTLEQLSRLPRLKRLCLTHAELDDAAFDSLAGMSSLRELFVDHNRASRAAVSRLRAALPDCRITA